MNFLLENGWTGVTGLNSVDSDPRIHEYISARAFCNNENNLQLLSYQSMNIVAFTK